jgi:hypothetical protein
VHPTAFPAVSAPARELFVDRNLVAYSSPKTLFAPWSKDFGAPADEITLDGIAYSAWSKLQNVVDPFPVLS